MTVAFKDRLKQLRERAGLSQYALARQSGVSKQAISKLELGDREPTWDTVQALAVGLGVNPGAFAGEGEEGRQVDTELDLSPEAGRLLEALAGQLGLPPGQVAELALRALAEQQSSQPATSEPDVAPAPPRPGRAKGRRKAGPTT